jgi:hypothetical protein
MILPLPLTKQELIRSAIAVAMREFAPDVKRITYEISQDWTGEWALFFRVLISDEAAPDITKRVTWRMTDLIDLPNLELFPYFTFKSLAEQAEHPEPVWA